MVISWNVPLSNGPIGMMVGLDTWIMKSCLVNGIDLFITSIFHGKDFIFFPYSMYFWFWINQKNWVYQLQKMFEKKSRIPLTLIQGDTSNKAHMDT